MQRKTLIVALAVVLLCAAAGFADKDYGGTQALTSPCANCSYEFTSDEISFTVDQYRDSYHNFILDSDGKAVTQMDIVFQVDLVDTIDHNYCTVTVDSFYIDTALFDIDTLVNDSGGQFFRYRINPGDTVSYDNDTVFRLKIHLYECIAPEDRAELLFKDSAGYYSSMADASGNYSIGTLTSGYRYYEEPYADLSVTGGTYSTGDDVDSSYVGGSVAVEFYLDECNFDYYDGYSFQVQFDDELDYDSVVGTDYSGSPGGYSETDNSINIYHNGTAITEFQCSSPQLFMTMYFSIETDAAPETQYQVNIGSNVYFDACDDYDYIDDSNTEYVYVKTVKETAQWFFPQVYATPNQSDIEFGIFIKNSAPIYTDTENDDLVARFTFDIGSPTRTTYDHLVTKYSVFGGSMNWDVDVCNGDTLFFQENRSQVSVETPAAYYLRQIGAMVVNASSDTGRDDYNFLVCTDPEDELWQSDAFVMIKHTGNVLYAVDDVQGETIIWGALSLDSGWIKVYPPSCPTLYAWNGRDYEVENTILTQSQGQAAPEPVTDYYPIETALAEHDGFYRLEIRESDNEVTSLDLVELIVVDYPRESKIGISNEGVVFASEETIRPIAAVDEWGRDLMPYLGELDGIWMDADYPGSMVVTYPNPDFDRGKSYSVHRSFALGGTPPDPVGKKMVTVEATDGTGVNLFAEIESIHGDWYYLGDVAPREYRTENSRWLFDPDNIQLGETFRVRITWRTSYRTDLQALYVGESGAFEERRLAPYMAGHSAAGKIAVELAAADGQMVTIVPGDRVDLRFRALGENPEEGFARKFFLKSHGYYRMLGKAGDLPDDYALYDNYPNPFNPNTTIGLAIPVAGHVSLTVYNTLGQEVKSLHDGQMEAGRHQIVWNGENNSGQPVASGVYFYRLRADGFEKSKKMVLLK